MSQNKKTRYIDLTELAYETAVGECQQVGFNDNGMFLADCKFNYYSPKEIVESKPHFYDHFIAKLDNCDYRSLPVKNPMIFMFGNYSFGIIVIIELGIIFLLILKREGARWGDAISERFVSFNDQFTSYLLRYTGLSIYKRTRHLYFQRLYVKNNLKGALVKNYAEALKDKDK